ncbi:uncharacterized protein LOC135118175 [Helicoverpa armigera]|uniref:uncharacterized protein LOC135118175 n=1 Tax=Helicoverpa armigera TaxID=29058 RepID=UPI003083173A
MDQNKPPDPDPPDISAYAPLSPNYPLSQLADVACSIADSQTPSTSYTRKRSGDDANISVSTPPSKQQRNLVGRSRLLSELRPSLQRRRPYGLSVESQILTALRFYACGCYQQPVGLQWGCSMSQNLLAESSGL